MVKIKQELKCPICGGIMYYSHTDLLNLLVYYCDKDGKIEVFQEDEEGNTIKGDNIQWCQS